MTTDARSDLHRDLRLIDEALLDTIERLLAGAAVPADPGDRVLCRLAAERVLAAAETLSGLVSAREEPAARPLKVAA